MAKRNDVLQPVDDGARALARRLLDEARHAALAVLEPGTGHPWASRVAIATDEHGAPVMLVSSLAPHTAALQADSRCSLLLGEPGAGDPLAHPRMTIVGRASCIDDPAARGRVRERYLAVHPKAALYVDFADFSFWRVEVERAALNAGFGRAYGLAAADVAAAQRSP